MKPYADVPDFRFPSPWELEASQLLWWHEQLWNWEAQAIGDAAVVAMRELLPQAQRMGLSADQLGLKLTHENDAISLSLVRVDSKGNRRSLHGSDDSDYICDLVVEALKEEVFPSSVSSQLFDSLKQRLGKYTFKPDETSCRAQEYIHDVPNPYKALAGGEDRQEATLLLAIVAFEKMLEQAPAGYRLFAIHRPRAGSGSNLHWVIRPEDEEIVDVPSAWRETATRECTFEGPARVLAPIKHLLYPLTTLLLQENDDPTVVLMKAWSVVDASDLPALPVPLLTPDALPPAPAAPLPEGCPTGTRARGFLKDYLLDEDHAKAVEVYLDNTLGVSSAKPRGPRL